MQQMSLPTRSEIHLAYTVSFVSLCRASDFSLCTDELNLFNNSLFAIIVILEMIYVINFNQNPFPVLRLHLCVKYF